MSATNRRRHPRVKARGLAGLLRTGQAEARGLPIENISRGGLFVRCAEPLPVATPVYLELVRQGLPSAVAITGRVVSAVPIAQAQQRGVAPGMGVAFDPLAPELEAQLNELLALLSGPGIVSTQPLLPHGTGHTPVRTPALRQPPAPIVEAESWRVKSRRDPRVETDGRAAENDERTPPNGIVLADGSRLTVQVRALLERLGELQGALDRTAWELDALRVELADARDELARKDQRIAQLEARLGAAQRASA